MIHSQRRRRVQTFESHVAHHPHHRHPRIVRAHLHFHTFPDGILSRPESLGKAAAHHCYRQAASYIGVRDEAAALERDTHGGEITGRHAVQTDHRLRLDQRIRPIFDNQRKRRHHRRQRRRADAADRLHPGQRGDAIRYLAEELGDLHR